MIGLFVRPQTQRERNVVLFSAALLGWSAAWRHWKRLCSRLLLHELCQFYLSLIGTIDKNQIKANLSTYSVPCGMMSKSTALVNSFLLDYGYEFKRTIIRTITCVRSNMSIGENRHSYEGRWALGFLFLLFKNISLDNFLCYLILFIGNSKCRQLLKFTIKWNRCWQVFLTCDDIKNRPKTTFFVVNAGAQWLCLNTGSLTLHLSISHVSRESSKPSVECVCGSRQ